MNLIKSLLCLSAITLLSGCIIVAPSSKANYHTQQALSLDANTIKAMEIEAGAGELTVIGDENLTEIEVVADIYTDKNYKDNYIIDLYQHKNTAYLIAKNKSTAGSWVGESPRINLQVRAPKHLLMSIDDGSGDLTVSKMSNHVAIEDGSGDIDINDIGGNLTVDDGSGDLTARNVTGDVSINDGSGDAEFYDVNGSLDIVDGSGDIEVSKVQGLVSVDDGSGSIDINNVGGLKIIEAGSGGIRVNGVQGGFEIGAY